jgi:hypothetical protein
MAKKILYSFIINAVLSMTIAFAQEIENHLKVLFVFNFSRYMDWPEITKRGDFVIGVYQGSEALLNEFVKSCEVKKVGNQKVAIRNISTLEQAKTCHILFIPSSSSNAISEVASALKTRPILIVSETMGALKKSSCINLFIDKKSKGETKFDLNRKAIEAKGIKIENSLMPLAATVY